MFLLKQTNKVGLSRGKMCACNYKFIIICFKVIKIILINVYLIRNFHKQHALSQIFKWSSLLLKDTRRLYVDLANQCLKPLSHTSGWDGGFIKPPS